MNALELSSWGYFAMAFVAKLRNPFFSKKRQFVKAGIYYLYQQRGAQRSQKLSFYKEWSKDDEWWFLVSKCDLSTNTVELCCVELFGALFLLSKLFCLEFVKKKIRRSTTYFDTSLFIFKCVVCGILVVMLWVKRRGNVSFDRRFFISIFTYLLVKNLTQVWHALNFLGTRL